MTFRAFVSSTFKDLEKHRRHVIDALRKAGIHVDPMEDWPADSDEPKVFSQDRVKGCHLCVLLVAFRRGCVPEGEKLSITQLEYEAALGEPMDVLIYLLDEDEPWPRKFDELDKDPEMRPWRARLSSRAKSFKQDPASIDIAAAITRWMAKQAAKPAAGAAPEVGPPPAWVDRHLGDLMDTRVPVPGGYGEGPRSLTLKSIYVPLKLRLAEQPAGGAEPTWENLLEKNRVALTGDAGSGKSVLLRYVAMQMAQRRRQAQAEGVAAPKLPILLDLAVSARDLLVLPDGRIADRIKPQDWLPVLAAQLGLAVPEVQGLLKQGNVLLLLDGLDEVPDPAQRKTLVNGIARLQEFFGLARRNQVIVTCREAAWGPGEAYAQFDKVTLQPMDLPTIHAYLTSWCRAVRGAEADAVVQGLERAVSSSSVLAGYAANPQMSRLLPLIKHDPAAPKQQRAPLLESFIRELGKAERKPEAQEEARGHLIALAVDMQMAAGRGETFNTLRVQRAERILGERVEHKRGRALLDALEIDTGMIEVERLDPLQQHRALVRFRHRTFQEYLAACHYAKEGWDELLEHAVDPAWSEVLALTGGVLATVDEARVKQFLEGILDTPASPGGRLSSAELVAWAPRVAAASVCLAELASYGLDPRTLEPARRAHDLVVPLLDDASTPVDIQTRARIAEGLGRIRDPRLASGRWVVVPAGPFVRGSEAEDAWIQERPRAEVAVGEYRIQRWPVTVAEYRRFMDEGQGYAADRWWDEEGSRWRRQARIASPAGWEQTRAKGNRPVTGVSWWEARAFCRFWSTVDEELPRGWSVELPGEAQWEKAAGGGPFPWGAEWQEGLANCATTGLQDVVAVGLFPAGHSPLGLWDMAGNVSELTGDPFGPYDVDEHADYRHGHTARGGSFASPPLDLRVTYRFGRAREERDERTGFRCVAVPGGKP